ncbi:MAG: hypothetical protein NUV80_00415 [Candidatus Berkelbacteria bacterium]|nr:hypothetical protein [Candidatus Berkelbacteria bacterium]
MPNGVYQCKTPKIGATNYSEVIKRARVVFRQIEKQTRRRPYLRSAYFDKEKVFLIISGIILIKSLVRNAAAV